MKTFLEGLGEKIGMTAEMVNSKAGEVVELVGAKAGEAVEIQKLKNQIRILEKGNENDLADLGRLMYERFKAGEVLDDETVGLCEAIQSREKSIEEYQQKLSAVKGDIPCERCGKILTKGMAYCPYCGEKAPEPEEAEDAAEEEAPETASEADFWDTVKDAVDGTADKAEDAAEKAEEKAEEILEKAADKAEDVVDKAKNMAEEATEAVKDAFDHAE